MFRVLSFWQVGSGAGEMGTFDSRPMKEDGLPVIPGKQVKGLCRQAVREALAMKLPSVPGDSEICLFGERSPPGQPLLDVPKPGDVRFDTARLPKADRDALAGQAALIAGLYRTRRSTAMTENGIAKPHSLRFDEVTIPLTLGAAIELSDGDAGILRAALPLIEALGSGRTRGLGRVIVTLEDATWL